MTSDEQSGARAGAFEQGSHRESDTGSGLPQALAAYFLWGLLPLYLILVREVPLFEFVALRIIWSVPICLAIVAWRRQWPAIRSVFASPSTLRWLLLSSTLIAVNWLVYVWAIHEGHVYAASLGYYINPLLNVLLGTIVLSEKLSRRQWFAVALAALGVALLLGGALTTLWVSLSLAFSFAIYGLVRKQVDVGALPGLTIETIILLPFSLAIAGFYMTGTGSSFFVSPGLSAAIIAGGFLTAVPLLLFAVAARRMDYSKLGFIQFLAPSIVFILGLTVFGEPLRPVQLACFICIWSAAGLFAWDLVRQSRKIAS